MSATEPARRGPGRPPRNGAPPPKPPAEAAVAPPQRRESASAELARLQAMRDANGGFLIPLPPGIDSARLLPPEKQGSPRPDVSAERAMAWFRAIHDAGGSADDMMLAWEHWRPIAMGEGNPKPSRWDHFKPLAEDAGRRHMALLARAEEEERPQKALQAARANVRQLEAEFMAESKYLLPLKQRLERARAELAAAEAAVREAA